jgi:hypothetical protein
VSNEKQPGFRMGADHRVKIKNSNILNALIEHVEGKREMAATQVSAGIALLRKVMPDLASIEHSGEVITHYVAELPSVSVDADKWVEQYAPKRLQ